VLIGGFIIIVGLALAGICYSYVLHSAVYVISFATVLIGIVVAVRGARTSLERRSVSRVMPSNIEIGDRTERVIASEPEVLAVSFQLAKESLAEEDILLSQQAIWLAMLASAVSDGAIDFRETQAVYGIYTKITGRQLSREDVMNATRDASQDMNSSLRELSNICPRIHEKIKPIILEAAYLVLAADRFVSQAEIDRLTEIAHALQLSREQYFKQLENLKALGKSHQIT